ncbi:hypothetical protein NL676_001645 [Syzygium grande]|nr:hypothetical protein NL676_001645 [Syzygium grande]
MDEDGYASMRKKMVVSGKKRTTMKKKEKRAKETRRRKKRDPKIENQADLLLPRLKMVFNLRTFSFTESVEDDPTPPKSFSLKELRVATDNFSSNNVLRDSLSGKVYRGRLADGSPVAVTRGCRGDLWTEEGFEAEMQVGSTVSTHPNVLRLRGFCRTKKELLLVYPLMINSTLSYNLRERPDRFVRPLDWTTRKQIALGAARGLAHLHNQGGFSVAVIVHEDVDDYISIRGTRGYVAPEFFKNIRPTLKVDVFSYGIMLLELISGKKIFELDELGYDVLMCDGDISLEEGIGDAMNELGREIDPNLQGNYVEEEAARLLRLALLCSHEDPSIRPEMSEVVRMLESQFLQRDPSSRSSWSQSEGDSTPYYSFPPSPSLLGIAP